MITFAVSFLLLSLSFFSSQAADDKNSKSLAKKVTLRRSGSYYALLGSDKDKNNNPISAKEIQGIVKNAKPLANIIFAFLGDVDIINLSGLVSSINSIPVSDFGVYNITAVPGSRCYEFKACFKTSIATRQDPKIQLYNGSFFFDPATAKVTTPSQLKALTDDSSKNSKGHEQMFVNIFAKERLPSRILIDPATSTAFKEIPPHKAQQFRLKRPSITAE